MSKQLQYIQNTDATWRVYMESGESFPRLWKQGNQHKKMIVPYILFVGCSPVQWCKCTPPFRAAHRTGRHVEHWYSNHTMVYVCLDCAGVFCGLEFNTKSFLIFIIFLIYYLYFVTAYLKFNISHCIKKKKASLKFTKSKFSHHSK